MSHWWKLSNANTPPKRYFSNGFCPSAEIVKPPPLWADT